MIFYFLHPIQMATKRTSPAHTAGPWFIDNIGNEDVIVISFPKDYWVAEIRTDKAALRLEKAFLGEAKANARLIAAAPDLLQTAKVAATQFSERIDGLREELVGDPDCDGDINELIGCYQSLLRSHNRVIAQATGIAA